MEVLRYNLFDKLISILRNSPDSELENEVISYLDSLKNFVDLALLKEHSKKLHKLSDLEWLNSSKTISLDNDFKQKLVLIDFWTYCCINCMHVIPLLNQIKMEYDQIVTLGCHSAKFTNEKSKINILNALKRHLIKHPVALDMNLEIWNSLGIMCWPTILVINPQGLIIAEFIGEVHANSIKKFLRICSKYYDSSLNKLPIDFGHHNFDNLFLNSTSNILSFPTKLIMKNDENVLFISDSGNNRVLGVDIERNIIKYEISGKKQIENSEFFECILSWPQGLVYDSDLKTLFIADTFSNLIRAINFEEKKASVLCGVDIKLSNSLGTYDLKGGRKGLEQEISSPWDLELINISNSKVLLIACAGTHQIWLYSFENKKVLDVNSKHLVWWKNLRIEWDVLICIAGNGNERNKNNFYPLQASFAQPSGLSVDEKRENLFIADSESSCIRLINLSDGRVKGFIGGDNLDPDNLFAYGDKDGKSHEAKLQHPLDVKFLKDYNSDKSYLIVADSYNNCLKKIDIKSQYCHKLIVKNGLGLNEPNGLCVDEKNNRIWVADTNNNSIKYLKIDEFLSQDNVIELNEFKIQGFDLLDSKSQASKNLDMSQGMFFEVYFDFKLNKMAQNSWKLIINKDVLNGFFDESNKYGSSYRIYISSKYEIIQSLEIQVNVVYCENGENMCKLFNSTFSLNEQDLKIMHKNKSFLVSFN
ncbi:unnamed protein product [Brachionus calyciflorus]|uniref:Thioredoxin-like fold domain-containing protein n=1 Tax=Brachionus calyciflorus TaxID=104777 RepID=A0A813YE08_9BILA|nr:unnamed protein product [Brachionus calyciflorus]